MSNMERVKMERPAYLSQYLFDWELFDVILGGKSALDANSFLGDFQTMEKIHSYLSSYGLNPDDPVVKAELFGNFQEAMSFIRRYFLKENNPTGLDLTFPTFFYQITDVAELFLVAATKHPQAGIEESLWAGIILKVMHTIIHMDKDLRQRYFPVIQQQIFDRFYKHIKRDADNKLALCGQRLPDGPKVEIPLFDFVTKAKKSRDSTIIKLLHKAENVAEELFDRVGVRFITHTPLDALRVVKFLQEYNVIIPHNIKPSRSINGLFDFDIFRAKWRTLIRMCLRNGLSEARFQTALNREAILSKPNANAANDVNKVNVHSSKAYSAIQFTCRQLITYKDPFFNELSHLKQLTKGMDPKTTPADMMEIVNRIKDLDVSHWAQEVRFFYPFEVQIVDYENHQINTLGDASHDEYKNSQLMTAMHRVFRPLLKLKKMD